MQSIGLIYFDSEYSCVDYHTKGLEEALKRASIPYFSYHIDRDGFFGFLQSVKKENINHFICFKSLVGGKQSVSVQNMFKVPIVCALLENSMHYQYQLVPEVPTICIDQGDQFYLNQTGCSQAFSQPLGARPVDSKIDKKDIDLIFFGAILDPLEALKKAEKLLPKHVYLSILNIIDYLLENPEITPIELFCQYIATTSFNIKEVQPYPVYSTIEYAVRSLDRINLLKNIKDYPVKIYGKARGKRGWVEILKGHKNLEYCGEVSYEESIHLMGRAKLVLNSSPHLRKGIHERVFYSLLMGSPCLSSSGPMIDQAFGKDKGVMTYASTSPEELNPCIEKALNFSKEAVQQGKEIVLKEFTWDAWLEKYLRSLPRVFNPKENCNPIWSQ